MNTRNLLLILLPILLATFIANFITPHIYRNVSSDFGRTQLILNALHSNETPNALLFGNSILMSGVDAKQMSARLKNGLIYNFGSNGQALKESFLYYSKIPKSTKKVLQFVRLEDLENEIPALTEPILRNFVMYGYERDANTEALLGREDLQYLTKSKFKINFDARVIATNVFNRSFRRLLRKDLDLERAENDLFFPNVYSRRVDPETYSIDIKKYNPPAPLIRYQLNQETLILLLRARNYFRERNTEFVLVLYPINSDLYHYTSEYKADAIRQLKQTDLRIVNCLDVLPSQEFVDYWHISKPGAKIFTDSIVQQLYAF